MQISIQILSVTTETKPTSKGSYQQLEVAYKDLNNGGKVASKKVMSFANKEVFENLSLARPVDVFNIETVKNEKTGYWDWMKATKGSQPAVAVGVISSEAPRSGGTAQSATRSGGWETPEERAKKQVYIIRQSSLSTAVEALSVGRKGEIKKEEIVELAKYLEDFIFGTKSDAVDLGTIETIPEDLPF